MSEIKLGAVLKAQSAYGTIRRKMADAGLDVSSISNITDLAPVLAMAVPDDLAEKATALLADEEALTSLLAAFSAAAETGGLVHILQGAVGSILPLKEDLK